MKFSATYLARDEHELRRLGKSLELLGRHTELVGGHVNDNLEVFCASCIGSDAILIAPIHGKLPSLTHSSRAYDGKENLTLFVSHGSHGLGPEKYCIVLSGACLAHFDICYSPIKELRKFFPPVEDGEEGGQDEPS